MLCRRISQLIQMRSIGISDTTSVDSPCHPEEMAHCRPSSSRPYGTAWFGISFASPCLREVVANNPSLHRIADRTRA
jgi:hypothetical protein